MSEFGSSIGSSSGGIATAVAPSMGMENSMGFSSKNLGNKNPSPEGKIMVSLDHGKGNKSPFARSASLEKKAQDTKPVIDLSNPIDGEYSAFDNKPSPIALHEEPTAPTSEEGNKNSTEPIMDTRVENLSEVLKNSNVLWERGDSVKNAPKPKAEIEIHRKPEGLDDNTPKNTVTLKEGSAYPLHQTHEEMPSAYPEPEVAKKTIEHTPVDVNVPETTDVPTMPGPEPQPQVHKTAEIVKAKVDVMTDAQEVTVTLPETMVLPEIEQQAGIMTVETLQEMLEDQTITEVRSELQSQIQPKPEADTVVEAKTTTQVEDAREVQREASQGFQTEAKQQRSTKQSNQEHAKKPQEVRKRENKKRKITISKAYFEKDVEANSYRSWEVVKAYIAVHYKWMRQMVTKMESTDIARKINDQRINETLQSKSIKTIEPDGSIKHYSEIIGDAGKLDSLDDLQKYIERAGDEYSATNMTLTPREEVVDGQQIAAVHNEQETFEAMLEDEKVTVILGSKVVKKPEFVRVELTEAA